MSLEKYKSKRTFDQTPEPQGGKPQGNKLHFVIQKHDASHLHYDFRLEMDGVLKSWAVPKGPSTDPATKRLAMMVEDHPYSYKDFEGIIPEGNYGAGTVIVWDEGTYEPLEVFATKKEQEKALLKDLKAGSLKIRLDGQKLKGEFALVKTKGWAENSWLLIKHKDEFASKSDITKKDQSVLSGKDLKSMAKNPDKVYGENKANTSKETSKKDKKSASEKAGKTAETLEKAVKEPLLSKEAKEEKSDATTSLNAILKKGKKEKMPDFVAPMLATLVQDPFDDPDWEYEVKWDGYRAVSYVQKGKVDIKSRNNKSFNEKYYPIHKALTEWNINAVVDGEIVVLNDQGISDFGALQNWRSEADGELMYYVFDLLWYDGKSFQDLPLQERKALLDSLIPPDSIIRKGFSIEGRGTDFFETAKKMNLEGIIAKLSSGMYMPGSRSKEWLKIKIQKRQEVIIVGYTVNEHTSKPFSALLLGVYDQNKELVYAGKVGTGFKVKEQKELLKKFKPLERKTTALKQMPEVNSPSRFRPNPPNAEAFWLKPELVCEISFTEITKDGSFRHPSYQGLRIDKDAKDVVLEKETPTEKVWEEEGTSPSKNRKTTIVKPPKKGNRKTLLNPKEETQVKKISGHDLKFTHLSKLYWPDDEITKRDLLNYYYQVAPYLLPYLKDRPQSLNRFPNGINGKSFYQKDITGKAPDWVRTFPYRSNDDDQDKNYLLGSEEATLLYMANLGAIEMNPWSSTIHKPDHPDWCILDLDPGKNSTFEEVIKTALRIKKLLDDLSIPGYPKTSGSTGIHIYIPLGAQYTYDQSQLLAKWIASEVQKELSDFTSIERMVNNRKGKLYLDYLQNRPGATLAAPYSARPKPGATVSMPLHWEEVKPGLQMKDFHIFNALDRLKVEGDLFQPVLGKGIDLEKVVRQFS